MSGLFLINIPIDLPALSRWAVLRDYGWIKKKMPSGESRTVGFDEGCAVHHLLTETFGRDMLQPFRMIASPGAKIANIYGYSRVDKLALLEEAMACMLPEMLEIFDPARITEKEMPGTWREGRKLGFEIRLRPVSRLASPLPADGAKKTGIRNFSKGAEVDAYLAKVARLSPEGPSTDAPLNREQVYAEWLATRLAGAAELRPGVQMTQYSRQRAVRDGYAPEAPDITLQGNLIIQNAELFQKALSRGLGRHRAYGYGMLFLRPASSR
jgi:CRISPR system Cascade subunit CasE